MKLHLIIICLLLLFSLISSHKRTKPVKNWKSKKMGLGKKRASPYIGGGVYPEKLAGVSFMVGLVRLFEQYHQYFCAGVIISDYCIITSRYCSHNITDEEMWMGKVVVRAGDINIQTATPNDHRIAHISEWTDASYFITLIHVKQRFLKGSSETRIPLIASPKFIYNASIIAEVFGWGEVGFGQTVSSTLKVAKVQLLRNHECGRHINITKRICTVGVTGYFCDSDGGAPLVYEDTLIGIALHPIGTCSLEDPQAYAKISVVTDVICKNLPDAGIKFQPPMECPRN